MSNVIGQENYVNDSTETAAPLAPPKSERRLKVMSRAAASALNFELPPPEEDDESWSVHGRNLHDAPIGALLLFALGDIADPSHLAGALGIAADEIAALSQAASQEMNDNAGIPLPQPLMTAFRRLEARLRVLAEVQRRAHAGVSATFEALTTDYRRSRVISDAVETQVPANAGTPRRRPARRSKR
jgi:hypothetical protein